VLAGAFAVGDVSGGAFKPAVAIGAMTMGMLAWSTLWLYLAAELLGAAAAALTFRALEPLVGREPPQSLHRAAE
jgi:aquaporin Z